MSLESAVPAAATPAVKAERKTSAAAPSAGPSAGFAAPVARRLSDEELLRAPLARQLATVVQRREGVPGLGAPLDLGRRIRGQLGGGRLLDAGVREHLEPGLNADLGHVRVHADAEADELARSLSAEAFTTGSDIFLRAGAYAPSTSAGLQLLAHEAVHTLQQAAGPVSGSPAPGGVRVSDPGDRFEQAARTAADRVVGAGAPQAGATGAPAAGTGVAAASGSDVVVQRALPDPKAFKKKTSATLYPRGKTLTEIDGRLAEYREVMELLGVFKAGKEPDDAEFRRRLDLGVRRQSSGALLDRLEQVLTVLVADTDFWLASHAGDDSSPAERRVDHITSLRVDANFELNLVKQLRAANLQAGAFAAQPNDFLIKMQGSASSVLERLGTAIGKAVPNPGDSVEAKVQVKVPADPTGVSYVGFRIRAQAWRQDGTATKIRCDIAALGGGRVAGLVDVGGALGVLLEAQGKTPEQAMLLISYAWYRKFREMSVLPREVANYMWGGSTDTIGWTRAEQWAANVEKASFVRDPKTDRELSTGVGTKATKNEYVRMAVLAGASAQAGLEGVGNLSATVEAQAGTHWDKVSLTKAIAKDQKKGKDRRTAIGAPIKLPERGAKLALGTSFGGVALTFKADLGVMTGEVTASVALMGRLQGESAALNAATWDKHGIPVPAGYVSLSGTLTLGVPMAPPFALPLIFRALKTRLAPMLEERFKSLTSNYDNTEMHGEMALANTMLVSALGALDPEAGVGMLAGALSGSMLAPVKLRMDIAGGYQIGARTEGWTFEVSISQVSGGELDVALAGLTLKRRERLMRLILTSKKTAKAEAADAIATKIKKRDRTTAVAAWNAAQREIEAEQAKPAASGHHTWNWQFD
ncbi:MAG: hypothetical protein QOJ35_2745 [Solirubrobacteraceae bacterium]|nr:hypothetical protein [Solirubrobacteraceae bacterium]